MVATRRPNSGPPGSARSVATRSTDRSSGAFSARGRNLRLPQSQATPAISALGIIPRCPWSSEASSRPTSTPTVSRFSLEDRGSLGDRGNLGDRGSLHSSCGDSFISEPTDWLQLKLGQTNKDLARPSDAASSRTASSYGSRAASSRGDRPRHELVPPPWGPQRANVDLLPPKTKVERQQQYQQALDEQLKAIHAKRSSMQNAKKEHAATSLEMTEALAGYEDDVRQLRNANVKELQETARQREARKHEVHQEERTDYQHWAKSAEAEQAMLYHAQHSRRKEEWASLASHWKSAAAEKQERREAERCAALDAERETNYHLNMGMVPHRRMKRGQPTGWPRQPLVLRQEAPTFGAIG